MRVCCAVSVLVSVVTAAVLLALVPAAAGQAGAVLYDFSYSGNVNGDSTDWGNGTELILTGTYDSNDLFIGCLELGGCEKSIQFQSVSLSIGGAAQTGVWARISELWGNALSIWTTWDSPPPGPDFVMGFSYSGASDAFPDTTAATVEHINFALLNHDGVLGDGMTHTSLSITVSGGPTIPEPATAALVLLGAGGLICRRRAA